MRAIGYFLIREGRPDTPVDFGQDLEDFCYENNHQLICVFSDSVESGHVERPGYQAMIEFMRSSGSEFLTVVPDAGHLATDLESVGRAMVGHDANVRQVARKHPRDYLSRAKVLGIQRRLRMAHRSGNSG